jgi:WS/DGAT/MGAT family acyltransferase
VAGQAMLATIMDVVPQPRSVSPAPEAFFTREEHSISALITGAVENFARFQVQQASGWMDVVEAAVRVLHGAIDPSKGLGAVAETAPATRFNRAVQQKRVYATGELPLAEVKQIAKSTGTTINDVFLTVCAGALRRYFEQRGELPDKSLIAGCPVSLRHPGDTSTNNQVTMMLVSLATAEANPIKRLMKIARSSGQGKRFVADVASGYQSDVSLPGLPALLRAGAQFVDRWKLADLDTARTPFNVVVSNVPGPRVQLFSNGARVLTHYPVSIPAHGQGVNITVQSYVDDLFFAITGCAKALPDAELLRDHMLAAFAELVEAVGPITAEQPEIADISKSRVRVEPRRVAKPAVVSGVQAA